MRFDHDFDWDGSQQAERDLEYLRTIIDRQGYLSPVPGPPRSSIRTDEESGLAMLEWMFTSGCELRYRAKYAPGPSAPLARWIRGGISARQLRVEHAHTLYAARAMLGMSQRALERLGGFPPAYISAAENGYREPEERYPRFLADLMDERGLEGSGEVRRWEPLPGRTWRPAPRGLERAEAPVRGPLPGNGKGRTTG